MRWIIRHVIRAPLFGRIIFVAQRCVCKLFVDCRQQVEYSDFRMHSNDNRAVLPLLMLFSCIYSQLRLNHSFCQQLAVNAYHQLKLFIPFGFAALGFALVYLYKRNFDFVSIVQIKKFRLFERFFYTCIFQHHYHQHLLTSL